MSWSVPPSFRSSPHHLVRSIFLWSWKVSPIIWNLSLSHELLCFMTLPFYFVFLCPPCNSHSMLSELLRYLKDFACSSAFLSFAILIWLLSFPICITEEEEVKFSLAVTCTQVAFSVFLFVQRILLSSRKVWSSKLVVDIVVLAYNSDGTAIPKLLFGRCKRRLTLLASPNRE